MSSLVTLVLPLFVSSSFIYYVGTNGNLLVFFYSPPNRHPSSRFHREVDDLTRNRELSGTPVWLSSDPQRCSLSYPPSSTGLHLDGTVSGVSDGSESPVRPTGDWILTSTPYQRSHNKRTYKVNPLGPDLLFKDERLYTVNTKKILLLLIQSKCLDTRKTLLSLTHRTFKRI